MSNKIVLKSAFWSYLNTVLAAIIGIISQPLMLNYFGKDKFGVWSLTLGVVAYVGNSNLGIPTATTVMISKSDNEKDRKEILLNSYKLLCFFSLLCFFIFFLINLIFSNWVFILGKFPENLTELAKQTVIISVILFLIKSPLQVAQASFSGYQDINIAKFYDVLNTLVPFVSLFIILIFNLDLIVLAYLIGIGYIFINIISSIHFNIRYKLGINFFLKLFKITERDIELSKYILRSGINFFIIGIAFMLIYNTDNFVISNVLGVAFIPIYSLTFKLYNLLTQIFNVFIGIFFPMYGRAYSEKRYDWIQNIYDYATLFFSILAGLMWLGGLFFAQDIINIWTGRQDMIIGFLLPFSLGGFVYSLSTVNLHSSILSGINKNKYVIKLIWIEGLINLVLSILFAKKLGVGGVALGTFIASIIVPNINLPKYVSRETNNIIKYNYKNVLNQLVKVLIPLLICTIYICYFIKNIDFILKLILAITVFIVYIISSYITLPNNVKQIINKESIKKLFRQN